MIKTACALLATIVVYLHTNFILCFSQQCNIRHLEWTEMTNFHGNYTPDAELQISVDSQLNLHIKIDLDYVGDSSVHQNRGYGTTYVIDFESYRAHEDRINTPNNCQNRVASSFDSSTQFSQYWAYSETPYIQGHIGSEQYLAYPPPGELWNVTMVPVRIRGTAQIDDCKTIRYQALIPWMTLLGCTNKYTNKVITLTENDKHINASGTLFVNVVSPYDRQGSDTGVYRVYQLIAQPFIVSFQKAVHVLGNTEIKLFRLSILAAYREGSDATDDNYFRLILLTESVEYLRLLKPVLDMSPQIDGVEFETTGYSLITDTCLVAQAYTCGQLWRISAKASCPPSDFSGVYSVKWEAECAPSGSSLCETYLNDYDHAVQLKTSLQFVDQFCDPYIYTVSMTGDMKFYDDNFATKADNYSFPVGDTAYVEVTVNFPTATYTIFEAKLITVLLCTYPDDYDENLISVDQNKGTGGCLDPNIDGDPYYPIRNGEPVNYNATMYDTSQLPEPNSNIVRFSFTVPALPRALMYVHTHLEVTLTDGLAYDRNNSRRLLQTSKIANRMSHFGASARVVSNPHDEIHDIPSATGAILSIIGIVIGSIVGTAFIAACILYFHRPQVLHAIFCRNSSISNQFGDGMLPPTCWCCDGKKPRKSTTSLGIFARKQADIVTSNRRGGPSQRSSRASSINEVILDTIVDNIKLDIESQNASEKID